ncbi:hypothetical protein DL765_010390 [Monosporascus sp. GIB2]|nr:hypothetical protein DL765_010390 [Monosporascus sp. GIB2]
MFTQPQDRHGKASFGGVLESEEQDEQIHMDEATGLFLEALGPLEDFSLTGFCANATFNAMLDRHGRSRRRLRLKPAHKYGMTTNQFVLPDHHIEKITQACPDFSQVELPVPRTKGDEQEFVL